MNFSRWSRKYYGRLARFVKANRYFVVIIVAVLILIFLLYPKSHKNLNPTPYPEWKIGAHNYLKNSIQDIICSQLINGTCYIVVDEKYYSFDYKRNLLANTLGGGTLSSAQLVPVKGQNFTLENSKNWDIEYTKLNHIYIKVMSSAPFLIDMIKNLDEELNLLFVGLGGSILNNFFNAVLKKARLTVIELDPAMVELSKKWFGAKESSRHKIFIEDGVKFLKNRASDDPKYDIIFLDACYNNADDELACPVKPFRTNDTIRTILDILTPTGLVVVNGVSFQPTNDGYSKLIQAYSKHFPNCFYLGAAGNMVLICTKQRMGSIEKEVLKRHYMKNMPKELRRLNPFPILIVDVENL